MKRILKIAKEYEKLIYKCRKEFRKAMGKKTIKIDGLQHFKLSLLKSKLSKDTGRNATIGDTIEYLYDYWSNNNDK